VIFVDLCCGSGAVTLRLIGGPAARPPAPYMGGKRRFAPAILDLLRLRGRMPDRIIMADAGPWATFWQTAIVDGRAAEIADALRALGRRPEKQGAALFKAIGDEPVPEDPVAFCAVFLALQHGNAMGRPVVIIDGRWRRQGYAHLSRTAREKGSFGERLRPWRIAPEVLRVASLPWPPLEVIGGPLQQAELDLGAGAGAYIDPPYKGTTGYRPAVLGRRDLRSLADRLVVAGVLVGISEGEPIPWRGWHHADVPDGGAWQARSFGPTSEWLTTSAPPARLMTQARLGLEEVTDGR